MSGMDKQVRALPDLKTILLDEIQFYTRDRPYLLDLLHTCSVLRWFDSAVISQLLPPERAPHAQNLVEQAMKLSFCEEHPVRGVVLSKILREHLLSQEELKSRLPALHQAAADVYYKLLRAQDLKPEQWFNEAALGWKVLAAEWLYHLAWVDPDKAWHELMLIFARAYAVIVTGRVEVAFSYDLLNRINFGQVQWPADSPYPKRVSELQRRIQMLLANQDQEVLDFLEELARTPGLTDWETASLYQWIGSTCFRDGGWRGWARERLEAAYQLAPNDLLILTELAAYHSSMGILWGRLDLARQYAEEAVRLAPDKAGGYLELGDLSQFISDWDAAISWYQKAREVNRQSIDAPLGLSEVYTARHRPAPASDSAGVDDLALALRWIEKADTLSMGIRYVVLNRKGGAYQAYLQYDEAQQAYKEAVQEDPERPEAYLGLGRLAAELSQHRQAEAHYRTAREKGSKTDADLLLAQLYEQQDKLEKAAAVCIQALEQQGKSLALYQELHNIYSTQGKWKEMEAAWRAWLKVDPGSYYLALCFKGDAYQAWAWKQRSESETERFSLQAKSRYNRALRIDPCLAWAHLGLAELAVLQEDAATLGEHRQAIEAQAPWAVYDTLVRLAQACLNKLDYPQALGLLAEAVQLEPARPEARLAQIDLYEAQAEDERLLQAWAELEAVDPTYSRAARLRMGDYYRNILDYEQARQQYELAALLPLPVEANLRLASLSKEEGNWQAARTGYTWIIENAPLYEALAQAELSAIALENKDFGEAESQARKAIVSDPESISGYIALAKLAVQSKSAELLQEARGRLKSACPNSAADLEFAIAESFRSLAEAVLRDGRERKARREARWSLQRAKQAYLQALWENEQRGRDYPEADLGVALILVQQKKYKEAEQRFQHALERFSPQQDFDAFLQFGAAFEMAGNDARAEKYYRQAIQTSSIHPFGHLFLAAVLRRQGRSEEASNEYRMAQETGGVSCLLLGRYYESQSRPEDALACYRLGMETSPPEELPALLQASAMIQIGQEDFAKAEANFIRSIELEPTLEGYFGLLQLLVNQDRLKRAEQLLKQAAEQPDLVYDIQVFYGQLLMEKSGLEQGSRRRNLLLRASKAFRKAIELDRTQLAAYQELGGLLEERGFQEDELYLDQALELYQEMAQQEALAYSAQIAAGRLYLRRKKFLEAEKAYQQAIALEPQDETGYGELADLRKRQGKAAEAMELYRQIIAIATDPDTLSLAFTYLGELQIQVKRFEEAIDTLEQALQQYPANDLASYWLGFALEMIGKDEDAASMYTRAVDMNPKYGDAYVGLGRVYEKLGRPEKVVVLARRLRQLDLPPDEAYEARRVIAISYAEAGENRRARAAFRAMIRLDPGRAEGYKDLANFLLARDQPEQAIAVYEQMGEQPALRYEAYLLLGDLQSSRGRLVEAEAAYWEALQAGPNLSDGYISLAVLLLNQERQEEAHRILKQMVERPGLAGAGYYSLGILLQQEGKFSEAEQAYREAARWEPEDPQPYLNLAELYQQLNRLDAAEEALHQALQLAPEEVECNRRLADFYEGQGAIKKAVQFYRKAAEVDRDAESAVRTFLQINLLLHRLNLPEEALEALDEAVRRRPNDGVVHYYLGETYLCLNQVEKARDAYLRATELEPKFGLAYVALGQVYGRLGEIQGVHQIARKIEKMKLEAEELYDSYLTVASAYEEGGFSDWAIETIQKAISLDPGQADGYLKLGGLFEKDGHWSNALDVYEKALELALDPDSEALFRVGMGRCYWVETLVQTGDDEAWANQRLANQRKAEAQFRRALRLAPSQGEAALWLGQVFEVNGQWAKARHVYSRALQAEQEPAMEASLHIGRGRCLLGEVQGLPPGAELREENVRKARGEFRQAIRLDPTDAEAYVFLGELYEAQGQWSRARRVYRQALAAVAVPESVYDFRLRLGQSYLEEAQANPAIAEMRQENNRKAEEEFRQAASLAPDRTEAVQWLAMLYESQGNWTNARQAYEQFLQRNLTQAEEATLHLQIGRCWRMEALGLPLEVETRSEGLRKAEVEFLRAIQLAPSEGNAYLELGMFYEDQGRWDEAVLVYTRLAAAAPALASSAYLSLAAIHRRQGKLDEQRQSCQAALDSPLDSASPEFPARLRRKGLAYFMLGEYNRADELLQMALANDGQDFMAHFYEALNLLCLGRQAEAKAELKTGIGLAGRQEDYRYVLEEARALAERQPDLPGLTEMLDELMAAKDGLGGNL